MKEIVVVAAGRSPIGRFGGHLKDLSPVQLASQVVEGILKKSGVSPQAIDQAIFGHVLQAGHGQNPARQVALRVGMKQETTAMTINQVCGSGMQAVLLGIKALVLDEAQVVLVGGMESMSQAPHLLSQRFQTKHQTIGLVDSLFHDGLEDALSGQAMGITAENLASQYAISRLDQDRFALESQLKASQAQASGSFHEEIIPIRVPQGKKKEDLVIDQDQAIRADSSLEGLGKLKPAFLEQGSVTAGNSSPINDGAAALILTSKDRALAQGWPILGTILAYGQAGVDPAYMGIGPVPAIKQVLAKTGLSLAEFSSIELNEAFAAQSLAVIKELGLDSSKVNPKGGAIALGHPIGCSGARILVTLLHSLKENNGGYGLASLCVGGGMGLALAVEV